MLHIRRDLHFFDFQLLATDEIEIRASTYTERDLILEFHIAQTLQAFRASRNFDDFENRARERRSFGRHFEAKAKRVWHDTGELPDLEHDSDDSRAADSFGHCV